MAKHVFSSHAELCHAWAHQTTDWGRGANMSFQGPSLMSYGTDIGRILDTKKGKFWVINQYRFSSSTSTHQGYALRAVPDRERMVAYDGEATPWGYSCSSRGGGVPRTPREIVRIFVEKWLMEPEHSRYKHIRRQRRLEQIGYLIKAIRVAKLMGVGHKKLDKEFAGVAGEYDTLLREEQAYQQEREEKRQIAHEKERERRKEERRVKAQECMDVFSSQEDKVAWLRLLGDYELGQCVVHLDEFFPEISPPFVEEREHRFAVNSIRWRNGERVFLPYNLPIMIREKDGRAETSRHATVPLESARKTTLFALLKREKGWKRNGEKHAIGPYQLDEVIPDFGIEAGCHRIAWNELIKFGTDQGWI